MKKKRRTEEFINGWLSNFSEFGPDLIEIVKWNKESWKKPSNIFEKQWKWGWRVFMYGAKQEKGWEDKLRESKKLIMTFHPSKDRRDKMILEDRDGN